MTLLSCGQTKPDGRAALGYIHLSERSTDRNSRFMISATKQKVLHSATSSVRLLRSTQDRHYAWRCQRSRCRRKSSFPSVIERRSWTAAGLPQVPRTCFARCQEEGKRAIRTYRAGSTDRPLRIIQAQKFINEYASFLKRQGKLPIPGSSAPLLPLPPPLAQEIYDARTYA